MVTWVAVTPGADAVLGPPDVLLGPPLPAVVAVAAVVELVDLDDELHATATIASTAIPAAQRGAALSGLVEWRFIGVLPLGRCWNALLPGPSVLADRRHLPCVGRYARFARCAN